MRTIAKIEKDLESIKDGEYFSYVMGSIAPSLYFDGEVAYRISGIVYKKVDGKVWNTKVEGDPATGYIAKEWHISDDAIVENLLSKDCGFAIYSNERTVRRVDSFCVALNGRSNILKTF